jgi:hypothetical protein
MNERIKELAEQATLAVTKPDGHYIVQAWQAKFAELIVEDCFRVALVEGRGYLDPIKLRDAMKTHFGVE